MKLPPVRDSLGNIWRVRNDINLLVFIRLQNQRGQNKLVTPQEYLELYYGI